MSLGKTFLNYFKIGNYVTWRRLSCSEDQYYDEFYGIIIEIIEYADGVRPVCYARILENKSGKTFYVVLSCLTKVETN